MKPAATTPFNSANVEAETTGLITEATGTFTQVSSGISESGPINSQSGTGVENAFSLQLNSQFALNSAACDGSNYTLPCEAWEQFVYEVEPGSPATAVIQIQYWLEDYSTSSSCPSPFTRADPVDGQTSPDCVLYSHTATVTPLTASGLATVQLSGTAAWGGLDTVTMTEGSGQAVLATGSDSDLDLAAWWDTTQWNVLGDGGGAEAVFGAGASLEPQTVLQGSVDSTAPSCTVPGDSNTAETNNLNLTTTSALGTEAAPTMAAAETEASNGADSTCSTTQVAPGTASPDALTDQAWDDLFQAYGDTSGGWSGGDGAQSTRLPDGDTAWFFGDTYLGDISPDGTHGPLSTGIAHNSSVVYDASSGSLGPVNAGPPGKEGYAWDEDYTWVDPPSGYPATQYEMINGDQVIDDGTLYKFYQLADRDINPGGFQYKLVGTVLESFSISGDTLTPEGGVPIGVEDTTDSNPIIWGTAVLTNPGDGYDYIYGTEPYNASPPSADAYPLYVARVPVGDLSAGTADWQYYDDATSTCEPSTGDWSSSSSAAVPIMAGGTSSGFSVSDVNGVYVLLTNDSTGTYNDAVAYYAACPTGFSGTSPVYQVYAPGVPSGYLTYEYRIVPQFSDGSHVLISYSEDTENVDASCMGQNYYDSSIYRPRFLAVALPNLPGSSGAVTDPPDNPPPAYTAPVVSPDPMYAPTGDYPGTSTPTSQFCSAGATPLNSPSLTVTGNSDGVMDLSWSLQPTAMWMYSVVYCDETYWAAQGTPCPSNLVGPSGNDLTQAIPACSNQVASTADCGFNLDFGNPGSTLADLNYGDTYEVQVETCLAVEGGVYVGSNVITETGDLPMAARRLPMAARHVSERGNDAGTSARRLRLDRVSGGPRGAVVRLDAVLAGQAAHPVEPAVHATRSSTWPVSRPSVRPAIRTRSATSSAITAGRP